MGEVANFIISKRVAYYTFDCRKTRFQSTRIRFLIERWRISRG